MPLEIDQIETPRRLVGYLCRPTDLETDVVGDLSKHARPDEKGMAAKEASWLRVMWRISAPRKTPSIIAAEMAEETSNGYSCCHLRPARRQLRLQHHQQPRLISRRESDRASGQIRVDDFDQLLGSVGLNLVGCAICRNQIFADMLFEDFGH
jgi:hypothetical protein